MTSEKRPASPSTPPFDGSDDRRLSQEPAALLPVPLGCHDPRLGPSLQIRLPAAVACDPSRDLMDAGGQRHWILEPLRGGWLHQVQGKYAAPRSAVPLHPRHRHRRGGPGWARVVLASPLITIVKVITKAL